jgi:CHAD domain-containing protein
VKARDVPGLDPTAALRLNAEAIVRVRFEELRGLAGEALAPEAGKAQHEMRIAAKRLRYVLEIFAPCLNEQAKETQQAAKRLQSLLGDMHDCDLMLPKVEHIPSASTLLRERRTRLFQEFVELWDETPIFHA